MANLRLEQLWEIVVEQHAKRQNAISLYSPTDNAESLWEGIGLEIAEAIRQHQQVIHVGQLDDPHTDAAYAVRLHSLNETYGSVMRFIPAMPESLDKGKQEHADWAQHRARQAAYNSAIADAPVPSVIGQTLYDAIEAYAVYCEKTGSGGESEPKDARSLKTSSPDMTLDRFGYDAILRIGDYWRARPISKRPGANGRPISARTAINRLKTTRRLLRWLHRSDEWKWKSPEDIDEALRINRKKLLTEEELLTEARGPKTWNDEELVTLYSYATDFERVFLLLGLNLGFSHSEVISFQLEDIHLETNPPRIARIRRKTGKYFEAALWPETIQALQWLAKERQEVAPKGNKWVVLTEKGHRPTRQLIANTWNRLLDRIQTDHLEFRRLPFKFLRKTAYQLVLEASGSLEIAGTFEGRGQLASDQYADAYGRRLFDRVFDANNAIRIRLEPMFSSATSEAFCQPRRRGGNNISLATINKIRHLWNEGVTSAEIARITHTTRATAYRYKPEKSKT